MSINDGKKWGEDSELGKLLKEKAISSLEIKMSSENQLFSEIYTKNQLFCEFSLWITYSPNLYLEYELYHNCMFLVSRYSSTVWRSSS